MGMTRSPIYLNRGMYAIENNVIICDGVIFFYHDLDLYYHRPRILLLLDFSLLFR